MIKPASATACSISISLFGSHQSKVEGKDQESIQSSTTPDPGQHMGKRQESIRHKRAKRSVSEDFSFFVFFFVFCLSHQCRQWLNAAPCGFTVCQGSRLELPITSYCMTNHYTEHRCIEDHFADQKSQIQRRNQIYLQANKNHEKVDFCIEKSNNGMGITEHE